MSKHFIPFAEQANLFMEKFNLSAHPNSANIAAYFEFKAELNYIAGQRDAPEKEVFTPDELRIGGTI